MNHLVGDLLSGSKAELKTARERLDKMLDVYATGGMDHAVDAISSIWEVSNKKGPVPSYPAPDSPAMPWGSQWYELSIRVKMNEQAPFIHSMQEGYLLDRKRWAKRSRGGVIEPIYFPRVLVPEIDAREPPRPGGCQGTEPRRDIWPAGTQRLPPREQR